MGVVEQLERIFHPRGLAIIGASSRPGSVGSFYLSGFIQQGFERDHLYVVHPGESEVGGVKAYPTARDIPGDVDLAMVFSPRETVPQVVSDCALKGIAGVAVFTAGFAENGSEGERLQREAVEAARAGGTRIIGPNCVGIYCPSSHLVNFAGVMPAESGPVGMISHSGSLTVGLPIAASGYGMHFSKVISSGNECDLNTADYLQYFGQDAETQMIVAYIEGVRDGRRFIDIAADVSRRKPIIVWKGGSSRAGSRSAVSHTGSLAIAPEVWQALCRQTGIVQVYSEAEMLDCLQALYYLPLPGGQRVAILAAAGGTGVTIADACSHYGLPLAELSPATAARLGQLVPSLGTSTRNPIDLGMMSSFDVQLCTDTIEALAADEGVDIIIKVVGGFQQDFIATEVAALARCGKPALYITSEAIRFTLSEPKPAKGVAIFSDGRRAVRALSRLLRYQQYRSGD